jgi:hypothetical protein
MVLLLITGTAQAIDKKDLSEVDTQAIVKECQVLKSEIGVHLVWWIPVEFWEASLRQREDLAQKTIEEIVTTLRPYSMLAVVQADISALGAFTFYEKEKIGKNLKITHTGPDGKEKELALLKNIPQDLELLYQQLKPVLAGAMGNLGMNFYFFTVADIVGEKRLLSPYEKGRVAVSLKNSADVSVGPFVIETPLDALFVPRVCPNGKKAHVSWQYCPWSGKKLD